MEKEEQPKFVAELKTLCRKHKIQHAAFCGTDGDTFVGLQCLDESPSMGDIFESSQNVGRLWQSMRELIRDLLDYFEKRKKSIN